MTNSTDIRKEIEEVMRDRGFSFKKASDEIVKLFEAHSQEAIRKERERIKVGIEGLKLIGISDSTAEVNKRLDYVLNFLPVENHTEKHEKVEALAEVIRDSLGEKPKETKPAIGEPANA